jgi:hypothetical protein
MDDFITFFYSYGPDARDEVPNSCPSNASSKQGVEEIVSAQEQEIKQLKAQLARAKHIQK